MRLEAATDVYIVNMGKNMQTPPPPRNNSYNDDVECDTVRVSAQPLYVCGFLFSLFENCPHKIL